MSRLKFGVLLCLPLLLLTAVSTVRATTLSVNCAAKEGLHSIGAALKVLQNGQGHEPSTINVYGACHENVVIQSLDRLTLNGVNGASVTDASGGNLDVISIQDSHDVAINGFTVNAGSGAGNGVSCGDFSTCRLRENVIQGATSAVGFFISGRSQATLDGDTLQNNGTGLDVRSSSGARLSAAATAKPLTARGNIIGVVVRRGGYAFFSAVIENNSGGGVDVAFASILELADSSISGNGSVGVLVREGSFARFQRSNITGNAGGGVVYSDLSMGDFVGTTVSSNGGQTDVLCNPQFSATRGTATIGGTTNCVEP